LTYALTTLNWRSQLGSWYGPSRILGDSAKET
jgi:hypothetical protein